MEARPDKSAIETLPVTAAVNDDGTGPDAFSVAYQVNEEGWNPLG